MVSISERSENWHEYDSKYGASRYDSQTNMFHDERISKTRFVFRKRRDHPSCGQGMVHFWLRSSQHDCSPFQPEVSSRSFISMCAMRGHDQVQLTQPLGYISYINASRAKCLLSVKRLQVGCDCSQWRTEGGCAHVKTHTACRSDLSSGTRSWG